MDRQMVASSVLAILGPLVPWAHGLSEHNLKHIALSPQNERLTIPSSEGQRIVALGVRVRPRSEPWLPVDHHSVTGRVLCSQEQVMLAAASVD
jgi:hypothetical protein